MRYFEEKKRWIQIALVLINICMLSVMIVLFHNYDQKNDEIIYEQNVDDIANINQAAANISYSFFNGRKTELIGASLFAKENHCTLNELMNYLYVTNAQKTTCYELVSTDCTGYLVKKDDNGDFVPLDYSKGYHDFNKTLHAGALLHNSEEVRFVPEFTDAASSMKSFALCIDIELLSDTSETEKYTLMAVAQTSDFNDFLNLDSGYEKLATILMDQSGNYIIGNPKFKSDNFYKYIELYNDLTLDQRNKVMKKVVKKGKGVLEYKNSYGNKSVFLYTKVPESDWYSVTSVPIDHFRDSNTDISLTVIAIILLLFLMLIDFLYMAGMNHMLSVSVKKEKKASSAKAEFFSRMSHDMRTPMNGILGLTELASCENDPEVLHKDIEKMHQSGIYMLNLINDTLDMQRIESGRLTLEPVICNVDEMITGAVTMVQTSAKEKNISIVVKNNNTELTNYIRVDSIRIRQIIINLMSNAIKFTPEGGKVTVSVEVLSKDEKFVHNKITVSDTGVGMSQEFIEKGLFMPFTQERNNMTMKYAGSGLGLSIVKNLLDMMNAKIQVESEPGKGTTFTIYIDFELVSETEVKESKMNQESSEKSMNYLINGKHILLCEDHPLNAEITTRLIKRAGGEIDWAKDGAEGIRMFEESTDNYYDIILMDIRMPNMDGIEATKRIRLMQRTEAKTIPIIAMSANAYKEDIEKSLAAGMNAHLPKPVEPQNMFQTIIQFIK